MLSKFFLFTRDIYHKEPLNLLVEVGFLRSSQSLFSTVFSFAEINMPADKLRIFAGKFLKGGS